MEHRALLCTDTGALPVVSAATVLVSTQEGSHFFSACVVTAWGERGLEVGGVQHCKFNDANASFCTDALASSPDRDAGFGQECFPCPDHSRGHVVLRWDNLSSLDGPLSLILGS